MNTNPKRNIGSEDYSSQVLDNSNFSDTSSLLNGTNQPVNFSGASLQSADFQNAELYYSKAIEINPLRFGPIYKNRAIARMELGDKVGCRNDLLKYLEQVPNAADRASIGEALNQL